MSLHILNLHAIIYYIRSNYDVPHSIAKNYGGVIMLRVKYFLLGIICSIIIFSSTSFSENAYQLIEAMFVDDINIVGQLGSYDSDIISYNKGLYVSVEALHYSTGLDVDYDEITRNLYVSCPYSQNNQNLVVDYAFDTANNYLEIRWNNVQADYYYMKFMYEGTNHYVYYMNSDGYPQKFYYYDDYCVSFTNVNLKTKDILIVESISNGKITSQSDPITIDFNNSKTFKDTITHTTNPTPTTTHTTKSTPITETSDLPVHTTYDLLIETYGDRNLIATLVTQAKITPLADESLSNQKIWLQVFKTTLANTSNGTGRFDSWSITSALNAANASLN